MHDLEIGENSKKLRDEYEQNEKAWRNSDQYKKANAKFEATVRRADKKFGSGEIDVEEYDKIYEDATKQYQKELPHKNYLDLNFGGYRVTQNGREYFNKNFVKNGGMELSVARLKDLGYNEDTAKMFVDKLAKGKRTLGDI